MRKKGFWVLSTLVFGFAIWFYYCIPAKLFDKLCSLVLLDKKGELLGAHVAKDAQWRFPQTNSVNVKFSAAILTFEDKRFYQHFGVDIWALARAIKINLKHQEVRSGASTISMQTIRLSRDNPSRTIWEKILEIFRALRLELSYSKSEILALYVSNAPFGGNVVGIDAASWKYFGKSQDKLSWAEASTLAVLPNAPGLIHPGKNREALLRKRNWLLHKLLEEQKIDSTNYSLALLEPLPEKPVDIPNYAPHLLAQALINQKENYQHTSIDLVLQQKTAKILENRVEQLKAIGAYNASALLVNAKTGEVLAYHGNTIDKEKKHQNSVDMIWAKRSSGSVLKPLLYAELLETGKLLPHQIVQDIPVDYFGYKPKNYTREYEGIVPADEMVSKSLNVPAVNLLKSYGVTKFTAKLQSYGFSSIDKSANHYGLSLILGGAEVTLWDLTKTYLGIVQKLNNTKKPMQVFTNEKVRQENKDSFPSKSSIWFMLDAMLNVTRSGENKAWRAFDQSQKIAWKTGTSFGGRDAWAIGCTPEYIVAVWAGNTDGEGRSDLTGVESASPILFDIFNILPQKNEWFAFPEKESCTLNVCSKSGMKANKHCQNTSSCKVPKNGKNSSPCSYCQLLSLDSTATYQLSDKNYPVLDRRDSVFFILNPIEALHYQKHHADYSPPPSSQAGSGTIFLTYPENNAKIYLPKQSENKRSNLLVKAQAEDPKDILFWTLDDDFLASTQDKHSLAIQPQKGVHTLSLVNKNGKRVTVVFEVLE